MADWYFERWRPGDERPHLTEVTKDFSIVFSECQAALKAGEIFRVRPPHGAEEQMQQIAKLGIVERI
jgi:hypothetical protein